MDEGVSGAAGKPRSATPNVYPYESAKGVRWRYSYHDSTERRRHRRVHGVLRIRIARRHEAVLILRRTYPYRLASRLAQATALSAIDCAPGSANGETRMRNLVAPA